MNITLFLLSLSLAVGLNSLVWKPEVIRYYGAKALLSSNGIGYSALLTAGAGQLDDLMRTPWLQYVQRFLLMFSTMNLSVGLFNLLPLPPLRLPVTERRETTLTETSLLHLLPPLLLPPWRAPRLPSRSTTPSSA